MAREVEQGGLQQIMQMMVEMRAADEKATQIREERQEREGKTGGLKEREKGSRCCTTESRKGKGR